MKPFFSISTFRLFLTILVFPIICPAVSIAEDWNSAIAHLKKAETHIAFKKFDAAIEELSFAEQNWKKDGFYAGRIALVYLYNLVQPERSIPEFQRANSQGGDKVAWIQRGFGNALSRTGDHTKAEEVLRKAIDLSREELARSGEESKERNENEISAGFGALANLFLLQDNYKLAFETTGKGYEVSPQSQEYWLTRVRTTSAVWLGHLNFIDENFSEAQKFYELALDSSSRNRDLIKYFEAWEIPTLLDLAKHRISLGRIRPEYEHTSLVLYIMNLDVNFKGWNGNTVSAKNRITNRQIERSEILQALLSRIIETMSDGKYTLSFKREKVESTIRDFSVTLWGGSVETRIPDLNSLEPHIGKTFFENRDKFDTFMIYWNGDNNVATTANGGGMNFPYVPDQMYSATRGFVSFPSHWCDEANTVGIVHEFFHNTEAMSGIFPMHGFEEASRKKFPGWKGNGQLDYFWWQFKNRLPQITNDASIARTERKWTNLNWLARHPDKNTEENLEINRNLVEKISKTNQRKAGRLAGEAWDLFSKENKKEKAIATFKEALSLNPYHPNALRQVADDAYAKGNFRDAEKYYAMLAMIKPEIWFSKQAGWIRQWKLKDIKGAIEIYQSGLKKFKGSDEELDELFVNLGRAYLDSGDTDKAIEYFDRGASVKSLKFKPSTAIQCKFWKGFTLGEKMGRTGEAFKLIKEAVDAGMNDSFSQFYLKKFQPN